MSSARYQVQTFTFFIRQPILILVREVLNRCKNTNYQTNSKYYVL